MKQLFILILITASSSFARFTGGPYDGFASAGLTGYDAALSSQNHGSRFHGGPQDGAHQAIMNGYDGNLSPQNHGTRFFGGVLDGSVSAVMTGYNAGQSTQNYGTRFYGGAYDGQDLAVFTSYSSGTSPQHYSPRFLGGALDGTDFSSATGLFNPITGDSDLDTLPDLWEAIYYFSITATGRDDDTDQDTFSARDELIADTDPTNPDDYLAFSAIENGPTLTLRFHSSAARNYSLFYSTNLLSWALLDGPRSGTGGPDIMTGIKNNTNTFYRLEVTLPD